MITVAGVGVLATVLVSCAGCAGKLMTIPIPIPPPDGQTPYPGFLHDLRRARLTVR
jgi:hypothetical protein